MSIIAFVGRRAVHDGRKHVPVYIQDMVGHKQVSSPPAPSAAIGRFLMKEDAEHGDEDKAYLRYVRIAPRKVQIVCDLIRGRTQHRHGDLMQIPRRFEL